MEKLDDMDIVAEIAYHDADRHTRCKAVERITDQQILEDIARTVQDPYVRKNALEKIDDPELIRDIKASWNQEQRNATNYADGLRDAVHQIAAEKDEQARRASEGRCPHCGVPLTTPRGGIPDGAAVYCSNCGGRVR